MTHPLTDKIISKQFGRYDGIDDVMVYDEDDIRDASDWQLKQVTEWLKVELRHSSTFKGYSVIDNDNFFKDLKKAMRPTQEDLEDQEDLKLVMERKRRNGPTTRLTLEELSMRPTQEDN